MHNAICCVKVPLLKDIYIFKTENCSYNTSTVSCKTEVLKTSRILNSVILICFSSFMGHEKQNLHFCSSKPGPRPRKRTLKNLDLEKPRH